ncbi:MAG: DUF2190 family protein [Bacteroidetes bacterium]|nr:DUF2190 family protein [Bacteroidota bacterium]
MKKIYFALTFSILLFFAFNTNAQDRRIRKDFDAGTILISVNQELNNGNEFDQSSKPYQEEIIGIATGNKNPSKKSDVVAKEGTTYIKVNNENGNIKKGDLITTSSISGVGMKATKSGMVIGIALEDANQNDGIVKAKILIQYVKQ